MKNYFDKDNIVWRKASLYIPATDENIKFLEKGNNLALIKEEVINVEDELYDSSEEAIEAALLHTLKHLIP